MALKIALSVVIPLAVFAGSLFIPTSNADNVHFHAGFNLYRDGQKVDLADWKYMHTEPCGDGHTEPVSAEEEQLEKAHLHDLVGDVAHVHRRHVTWGDFFRNLGIQFTGPVTGYGATGTAPDILSSEIFPYERIVIVEGELADPLAMLEAVPDEAAVRQIESASESCAN